MVDWDAQAAILAALDDLSRRAVGMVAPVALRGECWWCGAEMTAAEVTTMGDAAPRFIYMPAGSPGGADHACTVDPPTPGELLAAGAAAYDKIIQISGE